MYSHCYTSLGLLALLASNTLAAPQDVNAPSNSAAISATSQSSQRTKTVVVTVTVIEEQPPSTSLPSFATPPVPDSAHLSQEPDNSAPNTSSLVLPSFTYDPLPTSMASDISPSGSATLPTTTLGTSGSPTSASTTCAHSMSHFVPGKSTPPASEPPYRNAMISAATSLTEASSMSVSTTCSHSMSHIVPGKSDVPNVPAPTDVSTTVSASTSSDSTAATTMATSIIPSDVSSPSMSASTTRSHSMSHIVPSKSTASPLAPDSNTQYEKPWSRLPESSSHPTSPIASGSIINHHPPRPAQDDNKARDIVTPTTAVWKTRYIKHTRTRRVEDSKAGPERKSYWSRFFAIAEPVAKRAVEGCLACGDEGAVTCLSNLRYAWCKDGCLTVKKLGCDMTCEEGKIRREGQYCVR